MEMNWSFKHIFSEVEHPLLVHCNSYQLVELDSNNRPFCTKCKAIAPDEIITQCILLNAIVWDCQDKAVYQLGTGKRGWH